MIFEYHFYVDPCALKTKCDAAHRGLHSLQIRRKKWRQ